MHTDVTSLFPHGIQSIKTPYTALILQMFTTHIIPTQATPQSCFSNNYTALTRGHISAENFHILLVYLQES